MSKNTNNIFDLFKLPEMKFFWYFLPFLLGVFVIDLVFLPKFWAFISAGFFLILTALILAHSLRLAKFSFNSKSELSHFKSIFNDLFDAVIAYDQNFKILLFNRAAEKIFKLKKEEVENKYFSPEQARNPKFSLFCKVLFPSLASQVVRHSEAGEYPQIFDMSFESPKMELSLTLDRVVDPENNILGFVKIVHDRTREAEILRVKNEFIEVAAHQLRTPLTSINWIFESLDKNKMDESQKELVGMGAAAVLNVIKTVNDLLDVAQIEEGKYGYAYEQVDIVKFIEDFLSRIISQAQEYGVKLYFKKPNIELPLVLIDKKKFSIALDNLLVNAIKYNVENGEALIEIQRLENKPFMQISIKDTGMGISPEDMRMLFTKFFRGDNAQKTIADGTGLGLYITKNIIEKHGGEIWAESQLNRGTTFYFTLPTDSKMVPGLHLTND